MSVSQPEGRIRPLATMGGRGDVAEWLGRGLQSLVQRFESARRLEDSASAECEHQQRDHAGARQDDTEQRSDRGQAEERRREHAHHSASQH